jgi:hypothetical protein
VQVRDLNVLDEVFGDALDCSCGGQVCTNLTQLGNYQGFRERMKMSSTDGLRSRSLGTRKPLKPSGVTGFDLQKCGDRCWVRTNAG